MNFARRFIGLVLLLGGLSIIIFSLYSSYSIFTAKAPPPEIFKVEDDKVSLQKGGSQDLQVQLQELFQEQLKGILPSGSLPTLLNLVSWSVFAGILIFGGAQISGLGIKLIK